MATTNKEEYVDLFIPKGYANDEPNFFINQQSLYQTLQELFS